MGGTCEACTCEELGVEHVDGLVLPGVLTVQVDGVQQVFDEGCQHHGQQDCILKETQTFSGDALVFCQISMD